MEYFKICSGVYKHNLQHIQQQKGIQAIIRKIIKVKKNIDIGLVKISSIHLKSSSEKISSAKELNSSLPFGGLYL